MKHWLISLACAAAPPLLFAAVPPGGTLYVDATQEVGLDFIHFNGATGAFHFPEIAGQGAALFDYDGDGDLDLYLVQSRDLDGGRRGPALQPGRSAGPLMGRLYRNDLRVSVNGARRLRFQDVTGRSGLKAAGYGMGVAAGDVDNDGDVDLYLTFVGSNQLWLNDGDGTFRDVTGRAGVDDPRWSTSASFFDFDRDGWLDLFVANYVDFRMTKSKDCGVAGTEDYCGPEAYEPEPDKLLRNKGDGTFEDVSGPAGILGGYGSGLGVVSADFDGDGWTDVFVANDQRPDRLWRNLGTGRFEDVALLSGCALNRDGRATSSMGVVAADFDGDGDEDVIVTNLRGETNTLFINDGQGAFFDRSTRAGLAVPSRPDTGFGVLAVDVDADGWLDLVVANGAVTSEEGLARDGHVFPYGQPNRLFRNRGHATFEDVSARAGLTFLLPEVSRGLARGDLDNDGDADLVMANNSGPARVLLNQAGPRRLWLGLRLVSREGRDALGARVAAALDDGRVLWRRAHTDGSYCSAGDPRVLFQLGSARSITALRVRWPSGREETVPVPELGGYAEIHEGRGTTLPAKKDR